MFRWHVLFLIGAVFVAGSAANSQSLPNLFPFPNAAGLIATYNADGKPIDLSGPFFQSLGTNGRNCASCHQPAQGWSISPTEVKIRFLLTQGLDPIFRTNRRLQLRPQHRHIHARRPSQRL